MNENLTLNEFREHLLKLLKESNELEIQRFLFCSDYIYDDVYLDEAIDILKGMAIHEVLLELKGANTDD